MTLTQRILRRDNYECAYCQGLATEADHIFARAEARRQGIERDDEAWIVAACHDCNGYRQARRLVPPSWKDRIPELNEMTPGRPWIVFNGDPVTVRDVLR